MTAERTRTTFITRVPILLATVAVLSRSKLTHLTHCWALGALGLSMRTKSSSGKRRLEATNAVGLAGLKRWTGSTAQSDDAGFGPTWSKIQSIIEK
ncbi:hypothetical protein B0J14DRAFT_600594 [Halenospora varia]|nr:hypothetical protein B0J14DRAFT_600594 [Halenospora varia]